MTSETPVPTRMGEGAFTQMTWSEIRRKPFGQTDDAFAAGRALVAGGEESP